MASLSNLKNLRTAAQSIDSLIVNNSWDIITYRAMANKDIPADVMPEALRISADEFSAICNGTKIPDVLTQVSLLILTGIPTAKAVGRIVSPELRLFASHPAVDTKKDKGFANDIRNWTNQATGDDDWEVELVPNPVEGKYQRALLSCSVAQSRHPRTSALYVSVCGETTETTIPAILEFNRRITSSGLIADIESKIAEARKQGLFKGLSNAGKMSVTLPDTASLNLRRTRSSSISLTISTLPAVFADTLFRYIFSQIEEHGTALPRPGLTGHDELRAATKSAKYK